MVAALVVLLIIAVVAGVAWPAVMMGFSRLPRMDMDGDAFGEHDDPLLGWPPTKEDFAQVRRLKRVIVVMLAVLLLLGLALSISLGYIRLP